MKIAIFLTFLTISNCYFLRHEGPLRDTRIKSGQTVVEKHGKLQSKNGKILNQNGDVVALNGMSMFWSQEKPLFWNEDLVNYLVSEWKVEVVRAAMAVSSGGLDQGGYLQEPEKEKEKLVKVVDACIKNGVYVIIDWHIEGANADNLKVAKDFFAEMSKKYGKENAVLYEGWNEPTYDTWDVIKAYHDEITKTIRPYTSNLYIAGSPRWSAQPYLACDSQVKDTNVAYTVHFYAATHVYENRNWADQALKCNLAQFVTEWGTCNSLGNGELDFVNTTNWLDWAHRNGISTANWALDDKDESCAALKPGANPKGGWKESDQTESGKWVYEWLSGKAPLKPDVVGCCTWSGEACKEDGGYCDYSKQVCEGGCNGNWTPK